MIELQNTILEMIAKGDSLVDTASKLCLEVERVFPEVTCSILTIDPIGRIRSLAAPSLPASYSSAIDGVSVGPHAGTCGTAAYLGEEVATQDIATDPRWESYRGLVLPLGLKACWSRPIFGSQRTPIATFALYYRESRCPTRFEREIVDRCIHLCAIALDRHRRVVEYERRANTDALTGLANRAAFNAALSDLDCSKPGSWAPCLLDLDNLKVVNDTFGHHAGDVLLKQVADRLTIAAFPERAFRIGGDEFAIIVRTERALQTLEKTAAGYLQELGVPADCGGNVVVPRATMGVAVMAMDDVTAERVRQNADFALYHAKETGRGGHVLYWPGIGSRMTRRLTAIRDVDVALREDRIEAHYQPVVRLETGEIVGLEALCRMRVGDRLVSAAAFHEATTDAHIASALTARMMARVARDARTWLDADIPLQHVSINVSSADFHGASIHAALAATFEREGVPLEHLILEVTESVYMDDDAGVVRQSVEEIRSRGLGVALDDFGTGYASLTHLMTVPADYIKIDKSFVDRIVTHAPSQAIVGGVIGIAAKLGIGVVAEGIETVDQALQLLELGCTMGQGYLYSPAVSGCEAGAMMMSQTDGPAFRAANELTG
ncbi:MAG TPA: GGDEF domain-containing protein [Novosphingobium sp.]|nr:GGDEF domain-containing protein [Novosphingobium sp.]